MTVFSASTFVCSTIIFCMLQMPIQAKKKVSKRKIVIHGLVTETSSYCGGAQPSEELLEELRKPLAKANKLIYIKRGSANNENAKVMYTATTDEDGKFAISLPVGYTYCFVEEWKSKPFTIPKNTEFVKWDVDCLKARYKEGDYVLQVKKKNNSLVKINYHTPCFYKPYCGDYSGPLPP